MSEKVKNGKVISFSYTLHGSDDAIIEKTEPGHPMEYIHGNNNIIPGLEKAMEGMEVGEEKKVNVVANEAYGEYDKNLLFNIPKDNFPNDVEIKEGMQFQTDTEEGLMIVTVKEIQGDTVIVDANHPMAGENLTFDIKIDGIRDATQQELSHGHVHSHGQDH